MKIVSKILLIISLSFSFSNATNEVNLSEVTGGTLAEIIAKRILFTDYFKQIKKQNDYLLNEIKITGNINFNLKFPYYIQDGVVVYSLPYLKGIDVNDYLPSNWEWDKTNGKLEYILNKKQVAFIKAINFLKSNGKYFGTQAPSNENTMWYKSYGNWEIVVYKYINGKWKLFKIFDPLIENNKIILSNISELDQLPKIENLQVYVKNNNGILIPYICKNNVWYPIGQADTLLKNVIHNFKELTTNLFDLTGGSLINVPAPYNEWGGYKTFLKLNSPEGGYWIDKTEKKYVIVKNYQEFKEITEHYIFGKGTEFYFYDPNRNMIIKMIKNVSSNSRVYNPDNFYLELPQISDLKLFNSNNLPYSKYIIFTYNPNYFVKGYTIINGNIIKYNLFYGNNFNNSSSYGYVVNGKRSDINLVENNKKYFMLINDCSKQTCNGNNSTLNYYKGDVFEDTYYIFQKNNNPNTCKDLNQLTDCYN